jgi:hypothetical protein
VNPIINCEIADFDRLIQKLGLAGEETIARSIRVREWVRKHWQNRYVPEWLLFEMGINPDSVGASCNEVLSVRKSTVE